MKRKLILGSVAAFAVTGVFAFGHMDKVDTDADGQVSFAEFEAAASAKLSERFSRMDANGDGYLSADEMQRPKRTDRDRHHGGKRGKGPEKMLEHLDADNSGGIALEEFQGKRFTPDSATFAAADADGNGELDVAELEALRDARRGARGRGSREGIE